jgi:hypothetical protein
MCEFCTRHGEGKIWYKNAANYANDLLSDLRRRTYIENFLSSVFKDGFQTLGRLETIFKGRGGLPKAVKTAPISKAKQEHFGQVLPIEEIGEVVRRARAVVRMPVPIAGISRKKRNTAVMRSVTVPKPGTTTLT